MNGEEPMSKKVKLSDNSLKDFDEIENNTKDVEMKLDKVESDQEKLNDLTETVVENEEPLIKKVKIESESPTDHDIAENHIKDIDTKMEEVETDQPEISGETAAENQSLNISSTENHDNSAEKNVGMNQTLNKTRFSGILKQRYSDFMVRECDLDGNLVYLTDLHHIDKPAEVTENDSKELPSCPITDPEELSKIEEFVSLEDKKKKLKLTVDDDKEHRKLVHLFIKTKYKNIGELILEKLYIIFLRRKIKTIMLYIGS